MDELQSWNIDRSKDLYGINNWGVDYFDINDAGHIAIYPKGKNGHSVDLNEIISSLKERDIEFPVLLRFNDILRDRVSTIYKAFSDAIDQHSYSGKYFPAYPIKVNQQKHIVDVIRGAGTEFSMGLEVGSKPELIAVLAIHDDSDALLLCNGYKDENYIDLALSSQKVGRNPIIIIEKFSELDLVIRCSKRIGIVPQIGLRLRLSGKGAGRWENSGGDRAKFGLSIGEILSAYERLKAEEMLDSLRLIHFHAGSQLTSIAKFGTALKEAGQVYAQLRRDCDKLDFVDVGGGLGVDYDGSRSNYSSSMNYSVAEYARDVVWTLDEICEQANVPRPNIITEAGRATVAHSSVLVFDVLGLANTFQEKIDPEPILEETEQSTVRNLCYLLKELGPKNCQESVHDAIALRTELISKFNLGLVSMQDRATGDKLYWAALSEIMKHTQTLSYVPEDLQRLPAVLTDTYFCNFSVFQSLPDSWAIEQLFPIMPISRLEEKPDRSVVLADITCDSDGCISRFVDLRDVNRYLNAHQLRENEDYYFAAFLVGAYQEILGDLHNLFGDTNAVHIDLDQNGKPEIVEVVEGDTIREVLRYVAYEKEELCSRWRTSLEQAVKRGKLTSAESGELYKKYSWAFESYTYLKSDSCS